MFITMLWDIRATGFLMNDLPLPMVEGWQDWWGQFKLSKNPRLFVGESHCSAVNTKVTHRINGEVWLFDAHHDCGYDEKTDRESVQTGRWTCENWLIWYGRNLGLDNIHMRYPTHRTGAFEEEREPYLPDLDREFYDPQEETPVFDTIYVCRSGAWVPSWCDQEFNQWVADIPIKNYAWVGDHVERTFSRQAVDERIEALKALAKMSHG
jgi:hypothetical protein